jgi:hypothetical protein
MAKKNRLNEFLRKNGKFLLRVSLFIVLTIFAEWIVFGQVTFDFQLTYNLVFLVLWIFIGEFLLRKHKMFKLHPKNYWAAFLTPLFLNIFINLLVYKYVNIFAISTILSTLIITLLIDYSTGLISGLIFSLYFGILFGFDLKFTIFLFLPAAFVALSARRIKRRIEIIIPFLVASLTQIVVSYTINLYYSPLDYLMILEINFFSVLITMGLLPFFEYISRVYSEIGLLELGNLSNPLLKELSLKAPGTYYHSMIISNLAESATEIINGQTILARVGSYFHDIGKVWRPQFFTENQKNKNPHSDISAKLSSLILNNHVTYGIELARTHRLPILIEDMIAQHQGTRVKQFFYQEYYNQTGIKDANMFRYPGPIPQFKESAILMICDVTEAMTRTMKDLNAVELNEKLEDLINSLFFEGQLDDCELTLREIKKIKGRIVRTIMEMNHKRISYPKIETKELKE